MNAETRIVSDMLVRLIQWLVAHPDDEPGFSILATRLQTVAGLIAQLVTAQRNGLIDVRAAAARKRELRRMMLAVPIAHLAEVGALAARANHELGKAFRFKPIAKSLGAFQSAAHGMYAEALAHRELLVQHGLSQSVLEDYGKMLEEFDAAVQLGAAGRTAHTAATRELDVLTREVSRIVRAMDARNRVRFRDDGVALAQWISARTLLGAPRGSAGQSETPEPGAGDVRPAA